MSHSRQHFTQYIRGADAGSRARTHEARDADPAVAAHYPDRAAAPRRRIDVTAPKLWGRNAPIGFSTTHPDQQINSTAGADRDQVAARLADLIAAGIIERPSELSQIELWAREEGLPSPW
jgi:hypothetical protein